MFQGKMKAVTFSYDDGVLQDRRLAELFRRYGLKATFNLNSGLLGRPGVLNFKEHPVDHTKVLPQDVREIYEGHEIAAHTQMDEMFRLGEEFLRLTPDTPQILYVWGHAYEFDIRDDWARFEEFCKMMSDRDDIFYGTNKEVLLEPHGEEN